MVRNGVGHRGGGFTLLEVLVALTVLELGLLGAAGLLLAASGLISRAARVERAGGEVSAVADSLSREGIVTAGEVLRDGWRVGWEPYARGLRVWATAPGSEGRGPVLELFVP